MRVSNLKAGMAMFLWVISFCLWSGASLALSDDNDPVLMLERISAQIQKDIHDQADQLVQHPDQVYVYIERILVPHFDFEEMARWVIGRNAWKGASLVEQKAFIMAFRDLLIQTYGHAFLGHNSYTVQYYPLREPIANKKRVQVNSQVHITGHPALHISYRLLKGSHQWLVYDMIIEGVSLLKGFQAQFSESAQHHGLGFVTTMIRDHQKAKKAGQ
jgi:phospholipid transport system substrate-binding protein